MKTLHLSIIIGSGITISIIVGIMILSGILFIPSQNFDNERSPGLPDFNIGLVFNGTQTSRDAPFYLKQGQNLTLVVSITSTPTNLPVSLDIDSHVGFTKTNGIDSRLYDTKTNTPGQVMIYVSATKDATPNTYQILVRANNTQMGMNSNFYVKVIQSNENQSHVINTVESECENEFKPKPFEIKVLPNGTSLTINYTPVFLMKPNSTGKICTNNWRTSPEMNYSGKVITGIGKDDSSASQNVTVVADPDMITIDGTNKTIVYTITTSKNTIGFYRFSPMFSDCGGIPIAIGYDSTHLFDNDFPWLWETVPCPHSFENYEITGFTGIDVTYITREYR